MLVSIVIPCYNVEKYVMEALESALQQDHPMVEIIAVDNNSTDATWEILASYERKYPDLIRCLKESKPGAPAARNTGWLASRGEWIQFLDADDILFPDKISRQVLLLQSDLRRDMIVGTPVYLSVDGQEVVVPPFQDPWLGLFHGKRIGNTVVNLWSRKILTAIGGWEESLPDAQDPYLIFATLCNNDSIHIDRKPSAWCRARVDGSHISWADPRGRFERQLLLREQMIHWLKDHKLSYWKNNSQLIYSLILRLLRLCATEDFRLAVAYKRIVPSDFKPIANDQTELPIFYVKIYPLVGFVTLERARFLFGALVTESVKRKVKSWIKW